MDKRRVTMTEKELKRVEVVSEATAGGLTNGEAGELLGLSERQVQRLKKRYREEGGGGLAHGNRGKPSARRTPVEVRERVESLLKEQYWDYNTQHLMEILAERYDITVSYSTLRRIRIAVGYPSPRKRRAPRHRRRRERYPQEGMLLQADGSDHDWLEGRGPRLTLIAYIDDATNRVPGAVFREEEDAAGYMLALRDIAQTHGVPLGIYADRHTIFRSPKEPTLEEQLAGQEPRSQFGRVLDELGIQYIPAYSPQAKGRIEREFQTFQDRLVKSLREANASTCEEANRVLHEFLPGFNERFTKEATQPGTAFRQWPTSLRPSDVFCFKFTRKVALDNTISFSSCKLPIPPGPFRRSYARARVDVHQHLDGQLSIHYQGNCLASFQPAQPGPVRVGHFTPHPATLAVPPLAVQAPVPAPAPRPRTPYKPPPDHPWRRPFKSYRRNVYQQR
jgi:transposase